MCSSVSGVNHKETLSLQSGARLGDSGGRHIAREPQCRVATPGFGWRSEGAKKGAVMHSWQRFVQYAP